MTFNFLFDVACLVIDGLIFGAQQVVKGFWFLGLLFCGVGCRNPTLAKCEDETHTPKVGDLESSGTPESLEFDSKGKNTSPWNILGVIG
jgi:hypothetical protein